MDTSDNNNKKRKIEHDKIGAKKREIDKEIGIAIDRERERETQGERQTDRQTV